MSNNMAINKKLHLSPLLSVLLETLIVFAIIIVPLSVNIAHKAPPFSIANESKSGMSVFNTILQNRGYETKRLLLSLKSLLKIDLPSALVVAGGSKVYSREELLLIKQFVVKGGTLLVLAGGDTAELVANEFGIFFGFPILETVNYYKAPDIILVQAPLTNETLCFVHPFSMTVVSSNMSEEVASLSTASTAFVDENADGKWSQDHEKLRNLKLISIIQYGEGTVIAISTPSFLSNDLYFHGFGNINLVLHYLGAFLGGTNPTIYFDETHKRWPIGTTEGIINEGYGTVVQLAHNVLFLSIVIIVILVLYYFLPRYREILFSKENFRTILTNRIWSRERELYDTFGLAVKPTVEEKTLTKLYFLYETEGSLFFNLVLREKMRKIPEEKMKDDEKNFFDDALKRRLTHEIFILLFKKLEEIQQRRIKWQK